MAKTRYAYGMVSVELPSSVTWLSSLIDSLLMLATVVLESTRLGEDDGNRFLGETKTLSSHPGMTEALNAGTGLKENSFLS